MNRVDSFVEHVHLLDPLVMFPEHGASDTRFVGVPLCCNDYNDSFSSKHSGLLGVLSPGVPPVSVYGDITIIGL